MNTDFQKIADKCKEFVECDTARISSPLNSTLFLIIGFKKHTKDNTESYWEKNGERIDFEYVEEKVVASGKDEAELIESARHYAELSKMNWDLLLAKNNKDYLKALDCILNFKMELEKNYGIKKNPCK